VYGGRTAGAALVVSIKYIMMWSGILTTFYWGNGECGAILMYLSRAR